MTNLTNYSDQELSLIIQNDEPLYLMYQGCLRRGDITPLIDILDEYFIYSPDQLEDLKNDFENELSEVN